MGFGCENMPLRLTEELGLVFFSRGGKGAGKSAFSPLSNVVQKVKGYNPEPTSVELSPLKTTSGLVCESVKLYFQVFATVLAVLT